jgi:hypothetical protein
MYHWQDMGNYDNSEFEIKIADVLFDSSHEKAPAELNGFLSGVRSELDSKLPPSLVFTLLTSVLNVSQVVDIHNRIPPSKRLCPTGKAFH